MILHVVAPHPAKKVYLQREPYANTPIAHVKHAHRPNMPIARSMVAIMGENNKQRHSAPFTLHSAPLTLYRMQTNLIKT
jgi:hypothetical protein